MIVPIEPVYNFHQAQNRHSKKKAQGSTDTANLPKMESLILLNVCTVEENLFFLSGGRLICIATTWLTYSHDFIGAGKYIYGNVKN